MAEQSTNENPSSQNKANRPGMSRREFLIAAMTALGMAGYMALVKTPESARATLQAFETARPELDLSTIYTKEQFSSDEQKVYLGAFMQQCLPSLISQNSIITLETHEPYDIDNPVTVSFDSELIDYPEVVPYVRVDRRPKRQSRVSFRNEQRQPNNPLLRRLRPLSNQTVLDRNDQSHEIPISDRSLETLLSTPDFFNGLVTPLSSTRTEQCGSFIDVRLGFNDPTQLLMTQTALPESILSLLPSTQSYRLQGIGITNSINMEKYHARTSMNYVFLYVDEDNQQLQAVVSYDSRLSNKQLNVTIGEKETTVDVSSEDLKAFFATTLFNFSYQRIHSPSTPLAPEQHV